MIIWRNPWCHQTNEVHFFKGNNESQNYNKTIDNLPWIITVGGVGDGSIKVVEVVVGSMQTLSENLFPQIYKIWMDIINQIKYVVNKDDDIHK